MWIATMAAVAMAAPEIIGMSVHGELAVDDEGIRIGQVRDQLHVCQPCDGRPVEYRCAMLDGRCWILDGPKAGRGLPQPTQLRPGTGAPRCSVVLPVSALPCALGASSMASAEALGMALLRSDLAGFTTWAQPVELSVELRGSLRWATNDPAAFVDLPTNRAVAVTASQADAWRCRAVASPEARRLLVADPGASVAWVAQAEQRCDEARSLRSDLCASAAASVFGGTSGWCASDDPPPEPTSGEPLIPHSQVQWQRRDLFEYPPEARGHHVGAVRCETILRVSETGAVSVISIAGCPADFHDGIRDGLRTWVAYPLVINGEPTAARTRVIINFKYDR